MWNMKMTDGAVVEGQDPNAKERMVLHVDTHSTESLYKYIRRGIFKIITCQEFGGQLH